jgi:hypothetical protein
MTRQSGQRSVGQGKMPCITTFNTIQRPSRAEGGLGPLSGPGELAVPNVRVQARWVEQMAVLGMRHRSSCDLHRPTIPVSIISPPPPGRMFPGPNPASTWLSCKDRLEQPAERTKTSSCAASAPHRETACTLETWAEPGHRIYALGMGQLSYSEKHRRPLRGEGPQSASGLAFS